MDIDITSLQELYNSFKNYAMNYNVNSLQEFFHNLNKIYNLSFTLSVLTCPSKEQHVESTFDDSSTVEEENGSIFAAVYTMIGFFNFFAPQNTTETDGKKLMTQECITVYVFEGNQNYSSYLLYLVSFVLFSFLLWSITHLIKHLYQAVVPKSKKEKNQKPFDDGNDEDSIGKNVIDSEDNEKTASSLNEKHLFAPLRITFSARPQNSIEEFSISSPPTMDTIFDTTLSCFLKQLDKYVGFEIQQIINDCPINQSSALNLNDSSLQSPRVRKKWSKPQNISACTLVKNQINGNNLRGWMMFEIFCKMMNWSPSKSFFQNVNLQKESERTEALDACVTFLHKHCVPNIMEWNASILIVNYSLFLINQMLDIIACSDYKQNDFHLAYFKSLGSAANGSFVGRPDHFDVMVVMDFCQLTHLSLLHNYFCDEISAGHVVINVKEGDYKNSLQLKDCLYKGQVKDTFGVFLQCNRIEKVVDGLIRKAVRKLNTDHQHKMEKLPFKLKMSLNDDLRLIIDVNLFSGSELEHLSISVKLIPSICVESTEFTLLPKLFVVPSWRGDHRQSWDEKEKRVGTLTKLFLRGPGPRIPSYLFWNILVSDMETRIKEVILEKMHLSRKHHCYEDCLLILKALFSSNDRHSLLRRGEISSYVLSTVVNFLLMESSASAWKMSQLPDRVSDAIHFLRSAYTNNWLPNFVIHNPHLCKKIPAMDQFSPLLGGRQQNLLADIDAKSAAKTLAFIESRLQETGLSKVVRPEYSDEMWEYEFFLFG